MRLTTALLLLLPSIAIGNTFTAKVIGVADGDTITVLHDNKPVKIRLHGVDCPEKKQPFGQKAKQFTSKLVFGKQVKIEAVTKGRYGRTVAKVFVTIDEGIDHYDDGTHRRLVATQCLNVELVRAGLAWWYRRYAPKDAKLAKLEAQAKRAKRGLWADPSPVAPWDWRRGKRAIKCPSWVASGLLKKHVPGAWIGKRSTVIDGDTVLILRTRDGARVRVHLYGVDAPEIDQPYGKAAKRFVRKSKTAVLHVKPVETDAKGRVFAVVSWTNGSLNGWLVKYGMAWANKRQGCFPTLAAAEATARKKRRGLWKDARPVAPWDWRRGKRAPLGVLKGTEVGEVFGTAAVDVRNPVTGNVRSKVFHWFTCPHANCKNCRVHFKTVEQAKKAGYRAHKACLPAKPARSTKTKRGAASSGCYDKCLRRSSMQAVGWEAIKAQCRNHCARATANQKAPKPPKHGTCKRDSDCRIAPCCCSYVALAPGEKTPSRCKAPCACPRIFQPSVRCRNGSCKAILKRLAPVKPKPPKDLRCNVKSKVCHRPGCRHYRCKNCTATFGGEAEAKRAGYRVHQRR